MSSLQSAMSGLQRMEAAQDGMEASYEMQVGGGVSIAVSKGTGNVGAGAAC